MGRLCFEASWTGGRAKSRRVRVEISVKAVIVLANVLIALLA